MTIRITTLDNGLRIITDPVQTVETASVGAWVEVGARHEQRDLNGVSHLLEHMAIKGTKRRSARAIVEEIEAVGGHLNAYTSRENTAYFAKVLKEDVPLAIDLIGDILQNSTLDQEELERERDSKRRALTAKYERELRELDEEAASLHGRETAPPILVNSINSVKGSSGNLNLRDKIAAAVAAAGKVDVLINNGLGAAAAGDVTTTDFEKFAENNKNNAGYFVLARELRDHVVERQVSGAVVNIGSM